LEGKAGHTSVSPSGFIAPAVTRYPQGSDIAETRQMQQDVKGPRDKEEMKIKTILARGRMILIRDGIQ
jgi:hypothetical protein